VCGTHAAVCDRTARLSKSGQNGDAPLAAVLLIPCPVNFHHNGPFAAGLFGPQAPRPPAGAGAGWAAYDFLLGAGASRTWRP